MRYPPVIDAHHHVWGATRIEALPVSAAWDPLRRTFGLADLQPELESEGVTGTLLVQTLPSLEESVELLALARSVPWVQGVVGWVDLTTAHVASDIERLRSAPGGSLLVGLRHRVCDEPEADWLLRDDVRRGLAAVEEAGLTFGLAAETRELPAAAEVCAAVPGLHFVLDHLARPPIASGDLSAWGRALLSLGEQPNVSATLSGLVTAADWRTWSIDDLRHPVELALDAFGPERLMLGSDWPVCLLAGSYSDAIDAVRYLLAELPMHLRDEIRGVTAMRVYRLPRRGDDDASDDPPARRQEHDR